MAAGKEIRGKIKSVENTKKITKAMEMVAASKMRKAQERMLPCAQSPCRAQKSTRAATPTRKRGKHRCRHRVEGGRLCACKPLPRSPLHTLRLATQP